MMEVKDVHFHRTGLKNVQFDRTRRRTASDLIYNYARAESEPTASNVEVGVVAQPKIDISEVIEKGGDPLVTAAENLGRKLAKNLTNCSNKTDIYGAVKKDTDEQGVSTKRSDHAETEIGLRCSTKPKC